MLLAAAPIAAEILNSNTPLIRVRLGDNANGSINTVIYEPGIPGEMGGLPGVTAEPQAVSTTVIAGSSGVFGVRIETDINARGSTSPLTGTFTYDSSAPMSCVTPTTCSGETILFSLISWNLRDNDTHTNLNSYDNSTSQPIQVQTDTNSAPNGTDTQHRNYLQYVFDNADLLPAGTYEGTVTLDGVGTF